MRHLRSIGLVLLAALMLLAVVGSAQAKAPDPKAACKQGGFVGYVNPATGQPFTDQGQCVSFVAKGGTLVPVAEEPEEPSFTVTAAPSAPDTFVTVTGLDPLEWFSYRKVFSNGDTGGEPRILTASSEGTSYIAERDLQFTSCGYFPVIFRVTNSKGEVVDSDPYQPPSCF